MSARKPIRFYTRVQLADEEISSIHGTVFAAGNRHAVTRLVPDRDYTEIGRNAVRVICYDDEPFNIVGIVMRRQVGEGYELFYADIDGNKRRDLGGDNIQEACWNAIRFFNWEINQIGSRDDDTSAPGTPPVAVTIQSKYRNQPSLFSATFSPRASHGSPVRQAVERAVNSGVLLYAAKLDHQDLAGLQARDSCLHRAALNSSDLTGADLRNADLASADIRKANLTGASLYQASLSNSHAAGACFNNANLIGVDFSRCYIDETTTFNGTVGVIDFGFIEGYHVIAVDSLDCTRIKAGCHWFTYREALAYWGGPDGRRPEFLDKLKNWLPTAAGDRGWTL